MLMAHGHVEAQDKLHAANDVDWDDVNIVNMLLFL